MVRPHLLLHPPAPPVTPRPAATLLLVRDGPEGPQLLMTRRSAQARFAPGAYVFPGGAVDAADHAAVREGVALRCRPGEEPATVAAMLAAVREAFEELGVLLARDARGRWVEGRELAVLDRHAPLLPQCRAHGLELALDEVHWLAYWITDRDLPIRFDVPFFVAPMPPQQAPQADGREQFEPLWVTPAEALRRHEGGDFPMVFPTVRTLQHLQRYTSAAALLADCAARGAPAWVSCPRAGWLGGQEARFMEHEPPFGELELVAPDGQLVHALDWRHDSAVPLLRHLRRLTAPNPGRMTGPGTNAYLVGEPDTGCIVVDPGPDDAGHLERLFAAAGGDVRAIVCTHSHPDHAPGAYPLQARVRAAGRPAPPVLGLASAATARPHSRWAPERSLVDGERLTLAGPDGVVRHTLRVVHTPGHAANHLCLLLEEDGLLFSGDHILNGSTTVIDPPDGDMDAYLRSLERLRALCLEEGVRFILPAHGHVLGEAPAAIERLIAHRLQREAKVAAALAAHPQGDLDTLVRLAYDDVSPALWPVARRSLLAHLKRLDAARFEALLETDA
ncbi:Hydroxyacylglutathione hydrolase GloC [Tepidimonas sediminis]|uniref:Hydroxyacylglutathione hydrolase GloC n=1 Tax=Tepidimonas sediminis TaxID=2588941 RepID=A0A554WMP3_9BURK|nr:MBL fold metallo-hydrolase [Tepidimonas sediminis]TSE24850.1 Hydroxyacylglutathione hydrolase GloC [Tepidimonas sediminis]